jgi:hypothetical protein
MRKGVTPDNMQHRPAHGPYPAARTQLCINRSLGRLARAGAGSTTPDWLVQVEKLSTQGKIKKMAHRNFAHSIPVY